MEDVAAASGISRLLVYRHFDSKEELYRAVLERVSAALTAAWVREVAHPEHGIGVRVLLSVARDDPDGFALLWRHAAREPSFADYAAQQRERSTRAALRLMSGHLREEVDARWAASTVVATLVEAVFAWLEDGEVDRDDEVVALMTGAVAAMITSWSDAPPS
jgi:AcrR family transcriptional regulator